MVVAAMRIMAMMEAVWRTWSWRGVAGVVEEEVVLDADRRGGSPCAIWT